MLLQDGRRDDEGKGGEIMFKPRPIDNRGLALAESVMTLYEMWNILNEPSRMELLYRAAKIANGIRFDDYHRTGMITPGSWPRPPQMIPAPKKENT